MKNVMKSQLLTEVLTGLMVAATFALVIPVDAWADLATATSTADQTVAAPAVKIVSYASYIVGTVLVVSGIANAKKHADNPSSNPLAPAVGKLGAGAAMLAAPSVVGMLQQTGSNTAGGGNGSFQSIGGF